jgi:sporulation protein YlmC with PRC-barrel domain
MTKHSIAALSVAAVMSVATAMAAGTTTTPRTDSATGTSATTGTTAAPRSSADTTAGAAVTTPMGKAEASKLIGQSVETPSGDRIGEVEAVNIGADGKVTNVIVGVGGFLGVGERDVALGWKDLQITNNGGKVVANLTKSRLETMSPYKYPDPKQRGTVFEERAK